MTRRVQGPAPRGVLVCLMVALAATAVVVARQQPAARRSLGAAAHGTGALMRPTLHAIVLAPSHGGVVVPARRTSRFSLLGITWTQPQTRFGAATVLVRTRSATSGTWHTWRVRTDDEQAGDEQAGHANEAGSAVRGGSAPVWVGDSDGVQLQVRAASSAPLPTGLRLDLIDPGDAAHALGRLAPAAYSGTDLPSGTATSSGTEVPSGTATARPQDSPDPSSSAPSPSGSSPSGSSPSTSPFSTPPTPSGSPSPSIPPTPSSGVAAPRIISRGEWQADESLRRRGPQYGSRVEVVFVHHTDTTNDYACAESPAILRSLYAYHVLSRGWNDIGYNFLVDRCGTLFEGRYGGTDRPVIGAHTYGFNTNSTGVAVIGSYTSTAAPAAVLATLGRLAAWKLAGAAVAPSATSTLVEGASDSHGFTVGRSYPFAAVSGHRDGYATDCPGDALYAQLAQVRHLATQDAEAGAVVLSTIRGATSVAGRWYTTGRVSIGWTSTVPTSWVRGFEVLVDGVPAVGAAAQERSATLTLPPGVHALRVRADYLPAPADPATAGTSASTSPTPGPSSAVPAPSATDSAAVTLVGDLTPPTFLRAPSLGLRTGTLTATSTPVLLSWRAGDDTRMGTVLVTTPAGAPATFGAAATSWTTVAGRGRTSFSLTAYDAAGNSRSAAAAGTLTFLAPAAARPAGPWARTRGAAFVDGTALTSSHPRAALAWSFTGRSVAWIAERTPRSGQAAIYLDGVRLATVDLYAASSGHRQAVWVRNGLAPGRHTLRIVVLGTTHRPTVTTDGAVALD